MVLSEPVLEVIRRELRRVSPDVRIETDQIKEVLSTEVIKREVMEGEKAEEAAKKIARAANKALRAKAAKSASDEPLTVAEIPTPPVHPAVIAAQVSPPPSAQPPAPA